MPIEYCFLQLMPYTCQLKKLTGRNPIGGDPVYGTATSFRCQIEDEMKTVRAPDGQEAVAYHALYLFGAPEVAIDDIVILPDGSQPPILTVERWSDENGPHHDVIRYG
jgi:hypothetical protein